MKPVHQTTFYPQGNCYAACVASILELQLSEVPDFFNSAAKGEDRFDAGYVGLAQWLAGRGLGVIRALPMFDGVWLAPMHLPVQWHCIASGPSPRFPCSHAIVWGFSGDGGGPVHDPHPEGGYFGNNDPKSFDLIVSLRPCPTP